MGSAPSTNRRVVMVTRGMPTQDGAGVSLTRLIGTPEIPDLDPILMLDNFGSDDPKAYIAGFPPHPHRGFETVSYMIAGTLEHRDNKGGRGLITDGGVQWMTAGKGVVHSEMPAQTSGLMLGFQLWLNLPAKEKMMTPWYRDIPDASIPAFEPAPGVSAKLIAGSWGGRTGAGPDRATLPLILDLAVSPGNKVTVPVPDGHNGFALVFQGSATIAGEMIEKGKLAVLSNVGLLDVEGGNQPSRVLIVAGKPLREPIAKHGPFVMNTVDELRQAVSDYQRGLF
ncbi:MAG: pirin family protein [Micropepsaceae bacterium]